MDDYIFFLTWLKKSPPAARTEAATGGFAVRYGAGATPWRGRGKEWWPTVVCSGQLAEILGAVAAAAVDGPSWQTVANPAAIAAAGLWLVEVILVGALVEAALTAGRQLSRPAYATKIGQPSAQMKQFPTLVNIWLIDLNYK